MKRPSIFILGVGRLGSALGRGLSGSGWAIGSDDPSAAGRSRIRRLGLRRLPLEQIGAFDLVFLSVPDGAVSVAAREIAPFVSQGQVVAHGAGALSLEPLRFLRARGVHPGSLHPIQALAGGRFTPGVTAALDGDREAIRLLSKVAADLGLVPIRVPEEGRVQYHAAATISANLCMALADMAAEVWEASGAPKHRAMAALVPLLRGAVENLASRGLPDALTGPASRGDAEVVARHLQVLRGDVADVYRLLSMRLVALAERGGLERGKAEEVRKVLHAPSVRRGRGSRPRGR